MAISSTFWFSWTLGKDKVILDYSCIYKGKPLVHKTIELTSQVAIKALKKYPEADKIHLDYQFFSNLPLNERLERLFALCHQCETFLAVPGITSKRFIRRLNRCRLAIMECAKEQLKLHPLRRSGNIAAKKGEAFQATLNAVIHLERSCTPLQTNVKSAQSVFLLPQQGVVIKKSNAASLEEENTLGHLFNLAMENGVVQHFQFTTLDSSRFGYDLIQKTERDRGYYPCQLGPLMQKNIATWLSDPKEMSRWLICKNAMSQIKEEIFHSITYFLFRNNAWVAFTFSQLRKEFLTDAIGWEELIKTKRDPNVLPFFQYVDKNPKFFTALAKVKLSHYANQPCFFAPKLDSVEEQIYKACESTLWCYESITIQERVWKEKIKFSELQWLWSQCAISAHTKVRPAGSSTVTTIRGEQQYNLFKALEIDWKLIVPKVYQTIKDKGNPKLFDLKDVTGKVYIEGMVLLEQILDYPNACQKIFQTLNADSEYKALLTLEFQFQDLHPNNVGFVPRKTEEYAKYYPISFYNGQTEISFQGLLLEYLVGVINDETEIAFTLDNRKKKGKLEKFPELLKALKCDWELILFDTDMALSSESNLLVQVLRNDVPNDLIPLRSAFFNTQYKDKPLSEEVIHRLENSKAADKEIKNWVNRKDAPIRRFLNKEQNRILDLIILGKLEKPEFTISEARKEDNFATESQIRKEFATSLSDIKEHHTFWTNVQQLLSANAEKGWYKPYTVLAGDTIESIAAKFRIQDKDIAIMNGIHDLSNHPPGSKLKIKPDLTSRWAIGTKARYLIALQLFPRLTWRKRKALFQRQERRREYLKNFRLINDDIWLQESPFSKLRLLIECATSPFSTRKQESLMASLNALEKKQNDVEFKNLLTEIRQGYHPTFYNLAKAMYPLLADTYDLYTLVYVDKDYSGTLIGFRCINELITKCKSEFKKDHIVFQVAAKLEDKIERLSDSPRAFLLSLTYAKPFSDLFLPETPRSL